MAVFAAPAVSELTPLTTTLIVKLREVANSE
jgi:hypothetical protein